MKACEGSGCTAPHIVRLGPTWSGQFHAPAALIFQKNFCTDSLRGWIGYRRDFQAFTFVDPFSRLKCFQNSVPVFQLEIQRNKKQCRPWVFFKLMFSKLRKAPISFVMCVCLPVHMEQLGCHWTDIQEIWHLSIFRKSVERIRMVTATDKQMLRVYCWHVITVTCFDLLTDGREEH